MVACHVELREQALAQQPAQREVLQEHLLVDALDLHLARPVGKVLQGTVMAVCIYKYTYGIARGRGSIVAEEIQ